MMPRKPWWMWLLALFPRRRAVVLIDHDLEITVRCARQIGFNTLQCYRMSLHTGRCLLLPGGVVVGPCYVSGWAPYGDGDRIDAVIQRVQAHLSGTTI